MKLWPKAPLSTKQKIARAASKIFQKYGMTKPLAIAHFMSQISHECGAGTVIRENLNYTTPSQLMKIFGVGKHSAKVTEDELPQLLGHPQALAERVYGLGNPKKAKELGNTRPGDGWRFRGGGMLQLTGGFNFRRRGDSIGFNLYENPDQLNDPLISFEVAVAEFVGLGCVKIANADDGGEKGGINIACIAVTRKVNGGTNGLAERAVWLRRWKAEMPGLEEPVWAPREAELDKTPSLLGTRTGQIATATGTASAIGTASQVINSLTTTTDAIQTTSDTITNATGNVKDVSDHAVVVYQTVKPFLGMMPETWRYIAIGMGALVIGGVAAILLYRHWKIQETGA